ncbi:MAG: aquaporin, partial [Actinomycetota bacterium]|nr:aquaporin [Actinomycetota bacterium]
MGRDRDQGRPVEPGEARAHGNDPDAVEVRRKGGDGYTGGQRREGDGASVAFADAADRRAENDHIQDLARRGARQALDEKEQEPSSGGLYGSQIDSSHLVGAALAEFVGTFILVFAGTAVAVGAILSRPTAGAAYDSLAIALAFGLALAAVVAAVGHVSGGHVNPAVTLGMAAAKKFPWAYVPVYLVAQLAGAVLAAFATWLTFGGPGRSEA